MEAPHLNETNDLPVPSLKSIPTRLQRVPQLNQSLNVPKPRISLTGVPTESEISQSLNMQKNTEKNPLISELFFGQTTTKLV
jgi:hypothetical protein